MFKGLEPVNITKISIIFVGLLFGDNDEVIIDQTFPSVISKIKLGCIDFCYVTTDYINLKILGNKTNF